ncbi:MAG: TatD family hydrolase [Thiohalocapsa sp.]|jgi:TatD DNase family protein
MHLIDTHCHLDVSDFDADRDRVLAQCREAGVRDIVVPAIDRAGWPKLLALCADQAMLHPALGMHPVFMDRHADADLPALEAALAEHHPLAVGEIGLDFALEKDTAGRERQRQLCAAQLAIAAAAGLPVLLHVRKAHDVMLGLLRQAGVMGGIAHAFNGSLEQAHQYLDLGFRLGFGGMLTFERSSKLRRLAAELPMEAIVLETDAPDLTVASHRYERNSPEYLPEVLVALAGARDADPQDLAVATTANARAVLGIEAPAQS